MMSLSDTDSDQFEPIAVSSLESFDKEYSNRTEETKPDFYRFKALLEKPEFGKIESDEFITLYDDNQEEEETVFQLLIDLGEESVGPDQSDKLNKSQKKAEDLEYSETAIDEDLEKSEDTLEEKRYKKGIEKGQAKGTIQVKEGVVEILNLLEQSLKTADQTLDLLVEKYKTSIISLVEQVAKKNIMEEMEIDDEVVKSMILDAFKTLVQAEEVVLSVSQDDYEYIEMVKDEFFETVDSLTSVSVRSDPSIKRGSCKIETVTASISSDVESRLEAIFETARTRSNETI